MIDVSALLPRGVIDQLVLQLPINIRSGLEPDSKPLSVAVVSSSLSKQKVVFDDKPFRNANRCGDRGGRHRGVSS